MFFTNCQSSIIPFFNKRQKMSFINNAKQAHKYLHCFLQFIISIFSALILSFLFCFISNVLEI